jgi:hypothetical protein
MAIRAGAILGLHLIIQFRARVFHTTRRLARIHAMPGHFLYHCHAYGGDAHEFI